MSYKLVIFIVVPMVSASLFSTANTQKNYGSDDAAIAEIPDEFRGYYRGLVNGDWQMSSQFEYHVPESFSFGEDDTLFDPEVLKSRIIPEGHFYKVVLQSKCSINDKDGVLLIIAIVSSNKSSEITSIFSDFWFEREEDSKWSVVHDDFFDEATVREKIKRIAVLKKDVAKEISSIFNRRNAFRFYHSTIKDESELIYAGWVYSPESGPPVRLE